MASDGSDDGHKPQFFKVLLPGFSKKLSIPRAFHKHIIQEKHRRATLVSSLSKSWEVSVHQDSQDLYFGEGWEEFAHAHQLSVGYFVVFRYEGSMVFSFRVFDLSTCEKDYSPGVSKVSLKHKTIRREDHNSPSVFKCFSRRPVTRSYKQRMVESGKPCTSSHAPGVVGATKAVGEFENRKKTPEKKSGCSRSSQFEAVLNGKNVSKSHLNIPIVFKRSNNELSRMSEMRLRDPKGRFWSVRLLHSRQKGNPNEQTAFGKGWLRFVVDNQLKRGDKCIFQLVSNKKSSVMKVQVLRQ